MVHSILKGVISGITLYRVVCYTTYKLNQCSGITHLYIIRGLGIQLVDNCAFFAIFFYSNTLWYTLRGGGENVVNSKLLKS